MSDPTFRRNDWPTLGVEVELQLVDARTMALKSAIADVMRFLPGSARDWASPEFLQCYVELTTGVCRTVGDVGADLDRKVRAVERAADRSGTRLFWAAAHPFSRWRDQQITPDERYYKLAEQFRETVVRPVTFGLHVHVGVESGDKAVRVGDRLHAYLPLLLALSANSPFWHGRPTGYHAHRIELLEALPTGGLPPRITSWDQYLDLFHHLKAAGFIESPKDLWWDVRPSADNGTIEIRICDLPPGLPSVLGLTALMQCLVTELSERIDRGETDPECHAVMVRQNRWRACRYGLAANLVDPGTLEAIPARRAAQRLVGRLERHADRLGCARHLEYVLDMAASPSGAERQILVYEQTGDLAETVRTLVGRSCPTSAAEFPRPPFRDCTGTVAMRDGLTAAYPFSGQ